MPHPLVILGAGYTGRRLSEVAAARSQAWFATSREPETRLAHVPADRRFWFDLARQESWKAIPREADLVWCFPAAPLELIEEFAATLPPFRRLVVLGSTSAYKNGNSAVYPPPWIDEAAAIDLTKPRVQGEELLRREYGAVVLRVAGIYGPGRSPLEWIKNGLVSPSPKYVNLIQVEDLAAVCVAALERGKPGDVYNVSDGTPRTWDDICRVARDRWGVIASAERAKPGLGKRIDIRKLREEVRPPFRYPDLYTALSELA